MADPVAVVSVVGSTLVGLGGLASTTWGQHATRLWQGREGRASEMRAVLDAAATQIATAMQSAADAHHKLSQLNVDRTPERVGQAGLDKAAAQLASAVDAGRQIWVTSNRLRVRTGAEAHVALALKKAEHQVGLLVAVVEREKRDLVTSDDNYKAAWANAEAAERAFYDAAAKVISFVYDGLPRVVQPATYGQTGTGKPSLRGCLVAGQSHRNPLPCWELYTEAKMEQLFLTGEVFESFALGGYTRGDSAFSTIKAEH